MATVGVVTTVIFCKILTCIGNHGSSSERAGGVDGGLVDQNRGCGGDGEWW